VAVPPRFAHEPAANVDGGDSDVIPLTEAERIQHATGEPALFSPRYAEADASHAVRPRDGVVCHAEISGRSGH